MLIARQELRFDFGDSRFDLSRETDRELLGWIFNQFLYGEITGIQCGHWLYRAPHLNAASFLAKQAQEELSHVKKILRILSILGEQPEQAHPAIRFLATGMMGKHWGEHVALEMALGEGLVLSVFYAMAETIDDVEIKKILESAIAEEERHVEFGERETLAWLESYPGSRKLLLGLALVQVIALKRLKGFVVKKLFKQYEEHPVLAKFPEFYDQVLKMFEKRIQLIGLSDRPLNGFEKTVLVLMIPFRKIAEKFKTKPRLLTDSYLEDPVLSSEAKHFRL